MAEQHRFPTEVLIPYSVETLETYKAAVHLVNSATDNPAEWIELKADRYLENTPLFFILDTPR